MNHECDKCELHGECIETVGQWRDNVPVEVEPAKYADMPVLMLKTSSAKREKGRENAEERWQRWHHWVLEVSAWEDCKDSGRSFIEVSAIAADNLHELRLSWLWWRDRRDCWCARWSRCFQLHPWRCGSEHERHCWEGNCWSIILMEIWWSWRERESAS